MKKLIIGTLVTIITAVGLFAMFPEAAQSQTTDDVQRGIGFTGPEVDDAEGDIRGVIRTAIDIISMIVGVAAVIMVIVGGFKYITSAGDANSAKSAKDTILYAVIGLVVVALAQVIVRFVLGSIGPDEEETARAVSLLLNHLNIM